MNSRKRSQRTQKGLLWVIAAGDETTRMNSRKKAQKAQKKLGEECSFRCPGDPLE
jgi:hypothetical protein